MKNSADVEGVLLSGRGTVSILIDAGCSLGSLPVEPNQAGGDRLFCLSTVATGRAWQKGRLYGGEVPKVDFLGSQTTCGAEVVFRCA